MHGRVINQNGLLLWKGRADQPERIARLRGLAVNESRVRMDRIRAAAVNKKGGDVARLTAADVRRWGGKGGLSNAEREYLFLRRGGKCVHCQSEMQWTFQAGDDSSFTIDHIEARSHATAHGSFEDVLLNRWGLDNLQAMCMGCNRRAGNRKYIGDQPKGVSRHASIAREIRGAKPVNYL